MADLKNVTYAGNTFTIPAGGESTVYFDLTHNPGGMGEEWQRSWTATEVMDEVRAGKDVRIRLYHMNYFGEEPPSYVDVLPMVTAYVTESGNYEDSDTAEFVHVEGWQNSGGSQDLDRQDTMTITVRDYEGIDEMTVARKTVRIPKVPANAVGYGGYSGEARFSFEDDTEAMNLLQDSENGNLKVYSEDSNGEWIIDTELASTAYVDSHGGGGTALTPSRNAGELIGMKAVDGNKELGLFSDGQIVMVDGEDSKFVNLATKEYVDSKAYDDTALTARVAANEMTITTLNGTGEGSVSKVVSDAIDAVVDGAPATFDTLKELADWISDDQTGAAAMAADIASKANAADIPEAAIDADIATIIAEVFNGNGN